MTDSASGTVEMYRCLQAFAAQLAAVGVRDVCIAPGARSTPLTVTLARQPGLRCWSHIDERSASFFAVGLAKSTRRAVAIVCTSGTAAANFYPAVIEAAHGAVPLIVLTADRPHELRDREAGQTIDQIKLFGDYPKLFVEVGMPECGATYFRQLAVRAVQESTSATAGVVHLNFPLREPLIPTGFSLQDIPTEVDQTATMRTIQKGAAAPRTSDLDRLAADLDDCSRPLILCGPGDHDADDLAAVYALARHAHIPILADATSQLRAKPYDDQVVDTYEALVANDIFAEQYSPDFVLRFGGIPTCKPLRLWLDALGMPQVVVDPRGFWNDPSMTGREIWHTSIATTSEGLTERIGQSDQGWSEAWFSADRSARTALIDDLLRDPTLSGAGVWQRLRAHLDANAIVYVGNSLPIRQMEVAWGSDGPPVRVLCNRGANGIDGMVSSILGAAAGDGSPVVGVLGDLSFYHDMNGLLAARRLGVNATIIVLNNDGGGIFSLLPQAQLGPVFDEFFTTSHGMDFRHTAALYGCGHRRIASWSEFDDSVRESLSRPGTDIIEVPLDRDQDLAATRKALREASAAVTTSKSIA